jgi:mRNA interferase MazF
MGAKPGDGLGCASRMFRHTEVMVQKIAVTLDQKSVADLDRWVRKGKYPNRSRALQSAVNLLSMREKRTRLARELAKIDPKEERQLAEHGLALPGHWEASLLGEPEPGPRPRQAGLRPVLILSHDLFNRKSATVIAMAITSHAQKAGFPLTLALPAEMMPKASWVKISQIWTISIDRLGKKIAIVGPEVLTN